MASTAAAHRVTVFAWVEGDMVHTQSKFAGGRKAQDAKIHVYDQQGNLLIQGRTDELGKFSFKTPQKTGLNIVLLAGEGHRAEWKIRAEEFGVATARTSAIVPQSPANRTAAPETAVGHTSPQEAARIDPAVLRQIVEAAVDKKLQPVIRMLAESKTAGPTFQDIIGGFGYIFGLVGIATYFRYRK
jgi:nickel transport protein